MENEHKMDCIDGHIVSMVLQLRVILVLEFRIM